MRIVKTAALGGALALSGALLVPATHAAAARPLARCRASWPPAPSTSTWTATATPTR